MANKLTTVIAAMLPIAIISCVAVDNSEAVPSLPVREHMETVIAPATNIIWGIDDPQTDADWKVIDDATIALIEAMSAMKNGGTGPSDTDWASNPDWDAFSDMVIAAAGQVREAVVKRDVDGVLAAGGPLYTPCEACHLVYHPDFAAQ